MPSGENYLDLIYGSLNTAYRASGDFTATREDFIRGIESDTSYANDIFNALNDAYGSNGTVEKGQFTASKDEFFKAIYKDQAPKIISAEKKIEAAKKAPEAPRQVAFKLNSTPALDYEEAQKGYDALVSQYGLTAQQARSRKPLPLAGQVRAVAIPGVGVPTASGRTQALVSGVNTSMQQEQQQLSAAEARSEKARAALDKEADALISNATRDDQAISRLMRINRDGERVPDDVSISNYVRAKLVEVGVNPDGVSHEYLKNKLTAAVGSYDIIKEAQKRTDAAFSKSHGGKTLQDIATEQAKKAASSLFSVAKKENEAIVSTIDAARKKDIDQLIAPIRDNMSAANSEIDAYQKNIESQIALTTAAFEGGQMSADDANAAIKALQGEYEAKFNAYKQTFEQLNLQSLNLQGEVNSRYNRMYARKRQELEATYTQKAAELEKTFGKLDPKLVAEYKQLFAQNVEDVEKAKAASKNIYLRTKAGIMGSPALWAADFISGFGSGALKPIATALDWEWGQKWGDYISRSFTQSEDASIQEIGDLLDPVKFSKSTFGTIGGMVPTVVAGLGTAGLTGGTSVIAQLAIQGGVGMAIETAQNAGAVKDQVFRETGSLQKANRAANITVQDNLKKFYLYFAEGVPFISKLSLGIKGAGVLPTLGRAGVKGAIETVFELPQEFNQGGSEKRAIETIRMNGEEVKLSNYTNVIENKPFKDSSEKRPMTPSERLYDTALNVVAPTFFMGGAGEVATYSFNKISYGAGMISAIKNKMGDISPNFHNQFIYDLYLRRGENYTAGYITSLRRQGLITQEEFTDVANKFDGMKKVADVASRSKLTPGSSKVLMALQLDADSKKAVLDAATDETERGLAQVQYDKSKANLDSFIKGKNPDYLVVRLENNEQYVLTYDEAQEMLSDPGFVNKSKGAVRFHVAGSEILPNGQNVYDVLKQKYNVERPTAPGQMTTQMVFAESEVPYVNTMFADLESRMTNAEEIPGSDIDIVLDGLYEQLEIIYKNYFDTPAGQEAAKVVSDKIDQLTSYEFRTGEEVKSPAEGSTAQAARRAVEERRGIIDRTSGTSAAGPYKSVTVTTGFGERGAYAITFDEQDRVVLNPTSGAPITIGFRGQVNKAIQFVSANFGKNGMPTSLTFRIGIPNENGVMPEVTMSTAGMFTQEELLDILIDMRAAEVGEVTQEDFDNAYNSITRPDAIQEQTAGQVPVQPEARPGETVAERAARTGPEKTAQTGKAQVQAQEGAPQVTSQARGETLVGMTPENAIRSIARALQASGIKVFVIETQEEMDGISGLTGTDGLFVGTNGEIYFSLPQITGTFGKTIIFHEATHPVINIIRNTNPELYKKVADGLKQTMKGNAALRAAAQSIIASPNYATQEQRTANPDIFNKIENGLPLNSSEIARMMEPGSAIEDEIIVETIARIASGDINSSRLSPSLIDSLKEMINKMAAIFNIPPIAKVSDRTTFINTAKAISDALKTGKSIAGIVGEENLREFGNKLSSRQYRATSRQIAESAESMVVPGKTTSGWVQYGKKDGQSIVRFSGEATLENIKNNASDSYVNRAYSLAQYNLSGIDVKRDFLKGVSNLDRTQMALFERSFFSVVRSEIKKAIDGGSLKKKTDDKKADVERKKRVKAALNSALGIKDVGQLYDAIEAIGEDMDVLSASLITSLFQKRSFVYNDSVEAKIKKWKDWSKRGIKPAAWANKKISELVFGKRDAAIMSSEADGIYENMKSKVKGNLKFLYDLVDPTIRNLTKLWYDGANVIAQNFGTEYGLSIEQAAGIIASQSPQMPWFSNLHLAQAIMDIMKYKGNEVFTKAQYEYYVASAKKYPKQRDYAKTVKSLIGMKLSELSDYDAGIFIRSYYDLNMSRKAPKRLPSGIIVSYETRESSFSSYDTIEKGVSIFRNGSEDNISINLGEANKVRNFYNNIVDPTNPTAVTIDTHAMAAAIIMPFGASDTEIKFDAGSYAFYSDAYNELARELGLSARELQSITWEAIRAFFPDTIKELAFKAEVNAVWKRYSKGEITIDQARSEILGKGKDANKTEWSEHIQDWMDGKTGADYFRAIDRKGDVPGSTYSRSGQRAVGGVSAVAGANIQEGGNVLGRESDLRGAQRSSKIQRGNLVAGTYYEPNLTTDTKGNYIFFHVTGASKKDIMKGIDSRKFQSLRTSREEKGLQYGIASFYTKPEDGERMVGGTKYYVTIAPNKVYPMDTDPNGYRAAAEKKIKEGTPFREEKVRGAIAESATRDGFEMAIGEWAYDRTGRTTPEVPALRGDALTKLMPKEYKGSENFKTGAQRGVATPYPGQKYYAAKQDLFDIASDIESARNRKNKYDEVYDIANKLKSFGGVIENYGEPNEFVRDINQDEFDTLYSGATPKQKASLDSIGAAYMSGPEAQASAGISRDALSSIEATTPQAGSVGVGGDVVATAKALEKNPTIINKISGDEYYHGTSLPKSEADFTTANKDKGVGVRSNAFMGTSREQKSPFFFITSEKDVANDFAQAKANYNNDKLNPKEKHTSRIIPFKFDEKNSKVLDLTKDDYEQKLSELGFDPIDDYGMGMYDESMMWEYLDNPKFYEKLKSEGYDAVKYVEPKRGVGIAVLNSEKVVNSTPKGISEAYHKAKKDGTNPELVKAVEQSLKETPQAEVPKTVGIAKGIVKSYLGKTAPGYQASAGITRGAANQITSAASGSTALFRRLRNGMSDLGLERFAPGVENKGLRDMISQDDRRFYTPISWSKIKDRIDTMSEAELIDAMDVSDPQTIWDNIVSLGGPAAPLALQKYMQIQFAKRQSFIAAGNTVEAERIDQDIKEKYISLKEFGTILGQALGMYRVLKSMSSNTDFHVDAIEAFIDSTGGIITKDQRAMLRDNVDAVLAARLQYESELQRINKLPAPTESDMAVLNMAKSISMNASTKLNLYISTLIQDEWRSIYGSAVKGGLLTYGSALLSLMANTLVLPNRISESALTNIIVSINNAIKRLRSGTPVSSGVRAVTSVNARGLISALENLIDEIKKFANNPFAYVSQRIKETRDAISSYKAGLSGTGLLSGAADILLYGSQEHNDRMLGIHTKMNPATSMMRALSRDKRPLLDIKGMATDIEQSYKKSDFKSWLKNNYYGMTYDEFVKLSQADKENIKDQFFADKKKGQPVSRSFFKDLAKATSGSIAELNFRMLALTDYVPKSIMESHMLERVGHNLGLEGTDLELFKHDPYAYVENHTNLISPEVLDYVFENASELTMAKPTGAGRISVSVVNLIKNLPNLIKAKKDSQVTLVDALSASTSMAVDTTMPYVQLPMNATSYVLDFVFPAKPSAKSLWFFSKAKKAREAGRSGLADSYEISGYKYMSRAILGVAYGVIVSTIITTPGLIRVGGGRDEDDEERKMNKTMGPNVLNASALRRWLGNMTGASKDTTEYKDGDVEIDLKNLGVLGMMLYGYGSSYKSARKKYMEAKYSNEMLNVDPSKNKRIGEYSWAGQEELGVESSFAMQVSSIKYMLDQAWFLSIANMADVVNSKDDDGYAVNKLFSTYIATSAASIPLFCAYAKKASDIAREVKGEPIPDTNMHQLDNFELDFTESLLYNSLSKNNYLMDKIFDIDPFDDKYVSFGMFGKPSSPVRGQAQDLPGITWSVTSPTKDVLSNWTETQRFFYWVYNQRDMIDLKGGYSLSLMEPKLNKKEGIVVPGNSIGEPGTLGTFRVPAKDYNVLIKMAGSINERLINKLGYKWMNYSVRGIKLTPEDMENPKTSNTRDVSNMRKGLAVAISESNKIVGTFLRPWDFLKQDAGENVKFLGLSTSEKISKIQALVDSYTIAVKEYDEINNQAIESYIPLIDEGIQRDLSQLASMSIEMYVRELEVAIKTERIIDEINKREDAQAEDLMRSIKIK